MFFGQELNFPISIQQAEHCGCIKCLLITTFLLLYCHHWSLPPVLWYCCAVVTKSIRPVKNCDQVLTWLSVWSDVQIIVYGPADATGTLLSRIIFFEQGSSLLWTYMLRPFYSRPIALTQEGRTLVNDVCECVSDWRVREGWMGMSSLSGIYSVPLLGVAYCLA